jgi:transposase
MAHELQTFITELLSSTHALRFTEITVEEASVRLQLTTTAATACCPCYMAPSSAIHSRYQRHLSDLPWGTRPVRLHLTVRKFLCRNAACARQIFTERLPALVAVCARKTRRLVAALQAIGLALGGQPGVRLAARLQLPISAATLLRLVRAAPVRCASALQALGVDEWAWRRGHRYGTILVNLADRRVVDLLPDRSAASVAAWLTQHPTVTVACRDRSLLYADGIRRGAPQAVQVVGRFPLVDNLREAVEAFLITQRPVLQAAAVRTAHVLTSAPAPLPVTPMDRGKRLWAQTRQQQREAVRQRRHAPWVACYETIHALSAQGTGIATIARQLGLSRPTVYTYLRQGTPPAPRSPQRSGQVLRPYLPYLSRRWRESGADSRQLWRELQTLGYTHSARTVRRFITQLRQAADVGHPPESPRSPYMRSQGPSARAVSFVMVCPVAKRSAAAQTYLDQRCQVDAPIARAHQLTQAFLTLVRERRGRDLEAWITAVTDSGLDTLVRFARGLQEDLAAVTAGLTLDWSNGPVEGQVTRLKLLKRQGYGRAGFALLRQRVLQAA